MSIEQSQPARRARRAGGYGRIFVATVRRYGKAFRQPKAIFGLGVLALLGGLALFAPVIFPGGMDAQTRDSLAGASLQHPFGTDELGRDVLVRTIYAMRLSLGLILVAVPTGLVIGTLMGLSGMVSRRLGELCARIFDLILGFPALIFGITVALVIGPGWLALAITIALFSVPGFGRLARGALLTEERKEYVIAAQLLGVGKGEIMLRHILPNALDALVVQLAIWMIVGVFIEAGLSIVGLGIQPPSPSLGTLLNTGIRYGFHQPLYMVCPILALLFLAIAFNFIADALNQSVGRSAGAWP